MKYELELFSRIITGDLSPMAVGRDSFNMHIAFLRERYKHCIKHYKIRFSKKPAGEYSFRHYTEHSFHGQGMFLDDSGAGGNEGLLRLLIEKALPKVTIAGNEILEACCKPSKNHIDLEISAKIEYKDLKPEEARFHYYNILMEEEVACIKSSLNREVFSLPSEKEIALYVQNHQSVLETLIGILFELLGKKDRQRVYAISKAYSIGDIYKKAYGCLDQLLGHIERHFTKYLDVNAQVSYRGRILSSLEARRKLKLVYPVLSGGNVSKPLLDILSVPLNQLAHLDEKDRFTYQNLLYHNKFLLEFYILANGDGKIGDSRIIEALHRLNFNSLKFFNYVISGIRGELKQHETNMDKLELLYRHLKSYNQRLAKTKLSYKHNLPSLKGQVTVWLKEEVYYLKKKLKMQPQNNGFTSTDSSTQAKIVTQMSVAQLSYFTKVLYEIGVIANKNQRDIFRFLSTSLSTKNQANISFDSVSSKYYNVEHTTKLAVKDTVIKMLNHINKSK